MKEHKKIIILIILAIAVAFSLFCVVKQSEEQKYLDSIRVNSSTYAEYLEEETQPNIQNTENQNSNQKNSKKETTDAETVEDTQITENDEKLEIQETIIEPEIKDEKDILPPAESQNIQEENLVKENLEDASTEEVKEEIKETETKSEPEVEKESEKETQTTPNNKNNKKKKTTPVAEPEEDSTPAELIEINRYHSTPNEESENNSNSLENNLENNTAIE